jgi:hypothetical protein
MPIPLIPEPEVRTVIVAPIPSHLYLPFIGPGFCDASVVRATLAREHGTPMR